MKTTLVKARELLKEYWWFIAAIFIVGFAVWVLKPAEVVTVRDNAVAQHNFDSIGYVNSIKILRRNIYDLEQEIVQRSLKYSNTVAVLKKQQSAVQTLPVIQVVETFSDRIYVDVELEARGDTVAIVPIQGIKNALVLIYERDAALVGMDYYSGQDSLKTILINNQKELINIKDTRIVTLTKEFYAAEAVKEGLRQDLEKQQRKLKNRNRLIGIIAGAGAVAILVAVVK